MGRAERVLREAPVGAKQVRMGRRSVRAAAAVRLGLWRIRPVWRLLVVVQVGMIMAMLVTCAIPLFAQVALYAGLHGTVDQDISSRQLATTLSTDTPSPQLMSDVDAQIGQYVQTYLAGTDIRLQGTPDVSMNTFPLRFTQPSTPLSGGGYGSIKLFAYPHGQLTRHIHLLDGHLPQARQDGIEVLITALTASKLHLQVGSSLSLAVVPGAAAQPLMLHVAGIAVSATPNTLPNFDPTYGPANAEPSYYAVADGDTIITSTYPWSSLALSGPVGKTGGISIHHWNINWTYQLDVSRLTVDGASALLRAVDTNADSYAISLLQEDETIDVHVGLYGALSQLLLRIRNAQLAVGILVIAVVGLMLLFATQMESLLIERQEGFIALLRSRGASRRQIFVTFATQGIAMAVVALLVGPLLAVPLIRQVALVLFSAQRQSVAHALAGNPITLAVDLWPLGLVVTLVVVVTVLWIIKRASTLNILAMRQEAARSNRNPLWRKLYLDVLAALLAVAGYGALALAKSDISSTPDYQSVDTMRLLSVLGFVAPLFLMVGSTLLFLRVFPLLLRFGEWLAARGRGAPAQLAFAHLARSARQSTQVIVLLALATGFALTAIGTMATTDHYGMDAAAFDAGADFSGTPANPTADFTQLGGVESATKGYITQGTFLAPGQQPQDWDAPRGMIVTAVESERYAATAAWPDVNGTNSVAELMRLLRQAAPTSDLADTVPAIVDGSTRESMHATVGTILTLWMLGVDTRPVRFRVVAVVPYIPQNYIGSSLIAGAMLVDFARYAQALVAANGATSVTHLAPNYIWLRTTGDNASLHSLRVALAGGPYQLTDTEVSNSYFIVTLTRHDRRIETQEGRNDALYVELQGTLALGAAAALLLALFGTVVTLWIATRDRQVSFALLRALGSGPRRILQQVLLEHGVVCTVGLALGVLTGGLLTMAMAPTLPTLIFTRAVAGQIVYGGLPVHIFWPVQALGMTLGALAAVCLGMMILAARAAAQPPLGAVLRLNED